ncbi:MAG: hypothetical protein NXI09_06270 [Bacteroidetes bacterium]|nr:hypothetical protein [Bacteroidota bacterium]
MRNAIRFILASCSILVIGACSKSSDDSSFLIDEPIIVANFDLEYSYTCGWYSRADTFQIKADSVHLYQMVKGFGIGQDTIIDTSFGTPISWLNALYASLDMSAFQSYTYNSGGLPYDGCNHHLIISKDNGNHSVLMNSNDSLPLIEQFMNQVDSLWIEAGGILPPERN